MKSYDRFSRILSPVSDSQIESIFSLNHETGFTMNSKPDSANRIPPKWPFGLAEYNLYLYVASLRGQRNTWLHIRPVDATAWIYQLFFRGISVLFSLNNFNRTIAFMSSVISGDEWLHTFDRTANGVCLCACAWFVLNEFLRAVSFRILSID